jgi:nucleolar protein 53
VITCISYVEPSRFKCCISLNSIQDSLAQAVATEMQKVYQNELGPQPVPLTVPGQVIDEEDVSNSCSICFYCSL